MKPLLYGYMRVDSEQPDEVLRCAEQSLLAYADMEGYCFAALFYEFQPGFRGAFNELIETLKRTEARHVIVPSLDHMSGHAVLCYAMLEQLELETGALVHSLDNS